MSIQEVKRHQDFHHGAREEAMSRKVGGEEGARAPLEDAEFLPGDKVHNRRTPSGLSVDQANSTPSSSGVSPKGCQVHFQRLSRSREAFFSVAGGFGRMILNGGLVTGLTLDEADYEELRHGGGVSARYDFFRFPKGQSPRNKNTAGMQQQTQKVGD